MKPKKPKNRARFFDRLKRRRRRAIARMIARIEAKPGQDWRPLPPDPGEV